MSSGTARTSRRGAGSVVSLSAYKEALHAAAFLRGTFHEPLWLKDIIVEVADDGTVRIVVLLAWQTPLLSRCIPTAVDKVPVVQRVVG